MDVQLVPAILGGFLGAVAMTAMMAMAKQAGLTRMDMVLVQGAMLTGDEAKARPIGAVMHLVVMGALVIGSIYAVVFAALDVAAGQAWWIGAVLGAGHGVIAGMVMAMMPALHPRMGPQPAAPAGLHFSDPGLFARNYGDFTPVGLVAAHIVYGLVLGAVYGWLI